ncbi:MAG: FtsX-like permease family protein [Oscillospiraceae bacterium]|nr:FtsX-like permease family protein [Oscillospiraceae bacterium]
MKKKLILNTLRSVKNTKSRFIAIMAIIAIGSGFFAGVKSASPSMKNSAAKYLEEQGLADFHLMSELGFDYEDISAVSGAINVNELYAGYSADLMMTGAADSDCIVKVYSYDPESGINIPYVTEGRLPEKEGEVLADDRFFTAQTPQIGDVISLRTGDDREIDDILSRTEYTVVGKGLSPSYVSFERGSTTIGNGSINGWLLVPEENFSYDIYTDLYISLAEAEGASAYTDEYDEIISRTADTLEDFADIQIEHRKSVITNEAYEEINEAKAEIEDGKQKLDDAEKDLEEGRQQLADAEKDLEDGRQQIADAEKELADGRQAYDDGLAEYEENVRLKDSLNEVISDLDGIISAYETESADTDGVNAVISDIRDSGVLDVDETLERLLTGYMTIPAAYDDGTKAACRQGLEQYTAGLRSQSAQAEEGLAAALTELDNAKAELDSGEAELDNARAEIADGEAEIEKYKKDIEDGEAEIFDAKKEIADGEAEIADAEQALHDEIDDAKWYVFDRDFNPSYSNYAEDCDRVDAIADVFPVFFILVAALVCCTTMTRMVEEQRVQTGTLKALGYGRYSIISQYILYALAASIPGTLIGLVIGFNTLPPVIYQCYKTMYNQPYLINPFRWDYAVGCTVVACLCTGLSALYASRLELVSCPAQLMRPKPPKNGKRILLERVTFVWKRLKFTTKVTFRNLFRYKARLLMTVIGIAGCTALLLAGYGLQYSISSIVDKQYGEIFKYDALVAVDKDTGEEEYAAVLEECSADGIVSDKIPVLQETVDIMGSNDKLETYLLVTESPSELEKFIDLHERKSREKIALGDGVVLGEKLARLLGVTVGDSVYFNGDTSVTVDAICENYTFNYAYMTAETYEKVGFDEAFKSNMIMLNMNYVTSEAEDALSSRLVKMDPVLAVSFSSGGGEKFRDLVSSLSLIIVVIIVSAGALAFVVLFNLSNININERVHELATIKVLGFYDGEVAAYVYRENILLTLMGTIAGLGLGVALEKFVIKTAEVDSVMFSVEIPWYCFMEAAVLTCIFALAVNITLYFRLKKIDMATSLKAIE